MVKVQEEIGRLDPLNEASGTGFLGRIGDILTKNDYKVNSFGIGTDLTNLEGTLKDSVKKAADTVSGFPRLNPSDQCDIIKSQIRELNRFSDTHSNIFSSTVSASMVSLSKEQNSNEFSSQRVFETLIITD